ncbi:MAG: M56 family metallopeptidase [Phycisphaerales bacterium]
MISIETLNAAAQQWCQFMWSRAIDSAWVLLLVGILWGVLRRRASAQFGYCLFLLVLIKLATPVQTPFPEKAVRALRPAWTPAAVTSDGPSKMSSKLDIESKEATPAFAAEHRDIRVEQARRFPVSTAAMLMVAWSGVVAVLLCRFAYTEWTTLRAVRRSDDVDLSMAGVSLDQLRRTLRIGRPVRVATNPGVASPVVYGLWSPTLLIPADFADRHGTDQMRWILLHELAHIQRWDMPVKLFQKLVQFVFFFHPGVWIVNILIDRQREFACDDTAVLGSNLSRAVCGESFLHIVKRVNRTRTPMPAVLGILSPNSVVRKRLMRMLDLNRTPQSRLSFVSCLWLVAIGLLVIPFSAFAASSAEEPPTPVVAAEPNNATFPVDGYTQKDNKYIWKQSLSANVEDIKTVLCLSRDGDIAVRAHEDAAKNTVEVRATIILTPREKLAASPDAQKQILALKEKIGVILGRDDNKTPTRDDDIMTVRAAMPKKMPQDIGASVSMEVLMPARLALKTVSVDGDTMVKGLAGPVSIRTTDGDVSASECLGSLSMNSVDGDVSAVNCGGPLELKTVDGDVKAQKCSKPMTIQTIDGDVSLQEVLAGIHVKVIDGDIHVSFAQSPAEDCSLESTEGDISVVMPKTSNVTVDLKTGEGDLGLDAPGFEGTRTKRSVVGKLNQGGPAIKASSQDGDVSIKLE